MAGLGIIFTKKITMDVIQMINDFSDSDCYIPMNVQTNLHSFIINLTSIESLCFIGGCLVVTCMDGYYILEDVTIEDRGGVIVESLEFDTIDGLKAYVFSLECVGLVWVSGETPHPNDGRVWHHIHDERYT